MAERIRVTSLTDTRFRLGSDILTDADYSNRRTDPHELSWRLSLKVSITHRFFGSVIKRPFFETAAGVVDFGTSVRKALAALVVHLPASPARTALRRWRVRND